MEVIGAHGRLRAQGINLIDHQAAGEEVFIVRFLVGEGEDGILVGHDEGAARPDGQADEVVAIKGAEQLGEVRAHGVGHALGEPLQHVVRKREALAGEPDLREKPVRAVKPKRAQGGQLTAGGGNDEVSHRGGGRMKNAEG